jgi:hypothetical protein
MTARRIEMMRKILIALTAAAALAGGMAATTAPAQAKVHVFLGFGSPGYYDPGYGYPDDYYYDDYRPVHFVRRHHHSRVHCHWRRVWHHHHWVRVKQCHRHGYGY